MDSLIRLRSLVSPSSLPVRKKSSKRDLLEPALRDKTQFGRCQGRSREKVRRTLDYEIVTASWCLFDANSTLILADLCRLISRLIAITRPRAISQIRDQQVRVVRPDQRQQELDVGQTHVAEVPSINELITVRRHAGSAPAFRLPPVTPEVIKRFEFVAPSTPSLVRLVASVAVAATSVSPSGLICIAAAPQTSLQSHFLSPEGASLPSLTTYSSHSESDETQGNTRIEGTDRGRPDGSCDPRGEGRPYV